MLITKKIYFHPRCKRHAAGLHFVRAVLELVDSRGVPGVEEQNAQGGEIAAHGVSGVGAVVVSGHAARGLAARVGSQGGAEGCVQGDGTGAAGTSWSEPIQAEPRAFVVPDPSGTGN